MPAEVFTELSSVCPSVSPFVHLTVCNAGSQDFFFFRMKLEKDNVKKNWQSTIFNEKS